MAQNRYRCRSRRPLKHEDGSAQPEPRVKGSTLPARRHRQRSRERPRLPTVELPNEVIHVAITRGLLKAAQRADAGAAIQDWYAVLKRLSELD
jgi:hypothetical protein